MKKPNRRVLRNWALRQEMIDRQSIIPSHMVPAFLRAKGYEEAANAADERVRRRLPLYTR